MGKQCSLFPTRKYCLKSLTWTAFLHTSLPRHFSWDLLHSILIFLYALNSWNCKGHSQHGQPLLFHTLYWSKHHWIMRKWNTIALQQKTRKCCVVHVRSPVSVNAFYYQSSSPFTLSTDWYGPYSSCSDFCIWAQTLAPVQCELWLEYTASKYLNG